MLHINILDDQVRRVWTGLTTWTMSTGRRARQTGRISVLLASLGWEARWWSFFHCDFNHFLQLGGIGLATMGTIFASAMFGALMAPVVSGAFSRFQFIFLFTNWHYPHSFSSSEQCSSQVTIYWVTKLIHLLRVFLLNLQYSSLSEQISDSEFELPELPFRALRHGNHLHFDCTLYFQTWWPTAFTFW